MLPSHLAGRVSLPLLPSTMPMSEHTASEIPDDLRPYLDTIADRLLSGHAAVMVGAGFSRNAAPLGVDRAFPNWSQLGDRFYERLHGRKPEPNRHYLQVPALGP